MTRVTRLWANEKYLFTQNMFTESMKKQKKKKNKNKNKQTNKQERQSSGIDTIEFHTLP